MIEGTIVGIEDHGTIVSLVIAETPEQATQGVGRYLHLDHSPFRWIVEAETTGNPLQLIGREIITDGERINFTDECDTHAICDPDFNEELV